MSDTDLAWETVEPPDYDESEDYNTWPDEEEDDEYPEDYEDYWDEQRYLGDED